VNVTLNVYYWMTLNRRWCGVGVNSVFVGRDGRHRRRDVVSYR
jgi:hypothetical protein